jgi:hypothetical protein
MESFKRYGSCQQTALLLLRYKKLGVDASRIACGMDHNGSEDWVSDHTSIQAGTIGRGGATGRGGTVGRGGTLIRKSACLMIFVVVFMIASKSVALWQLNVLGNLRTVSTGIILPGTSL